MDELFTKYERELVSLRALCREYALHHPQVAAQLQLSGDTCNDPHTERLLQSVALLSARTSARLDDAYPQFTEALLSLLFPHYLRPFPSCAIARVLGAPSGDAATGAISEMPRGTLLESTQAANIRCIFKTVYDITPSPVVLSEARFDTTPCAPVATRLPEGVTATLTIRFTSAQPGQPLCAASAGIVRLYIDGDAPFCAALRDALFMHTRAAYVQLDEQAPWQRLPAIPVAPVGFADNEALIPFEACAHAAYRLLAEYFAFPEKFNFVDVDVPALLQRIPAGSTQCTLRLALAALPVDGDKARMLARLSTQHLLMGCTPVINLFRQAGVPITYKPRSATYPLLAHGSHPEAYEVYSVDRVSMVRQNGTGKVATEFLPLHSLRHSQDSATGKGQYWTLRHDETLALCHPGREKSITLVNADSESLEIDRNVLSVELTCTNRDLPCSLKTGAPGGDLGVPGARQTSAICLLHRPTRPLRPARASEMHWRMISHLAHNYHALLLEGAEGVRDMLALYDVAPSPTSRRQIGGIVDFDEGETKAWMRLNRGPSLVHGTEIRLTLDEDAYVGSGLHLFTHVLSQLFAQYIPRNSFVELVIRSRQGGKELLRCAPVSGRMALV